MSIPVIGLTTYNAKNQDGFPIAALSYKYVDAISKAGAAPVLIPAGQNNQALQSLIDRLDGILLTGGGDIEVDHYHGATHPSLESVDPERDTIEFAIIRSTVKSGKPFLGICRGFQVVNVALGGTLFTHIQDQLPGALKHDYDSRLERQVLAHEVIMEKESIVARILGETRLMVNSLHHQGADGLASGLRVAGRAPDGLVEAIELPDHPFGVAVQWHPEWLMDQVASIRLFRAFIEAAGKGENNVSKQ
jgi:putative glutamine amidotransferase